MSLGLTAKVSRKIDASAFSREQFLVYSVLAAEKLKWEIVFADKEEIVISAPFSLRSAGEEIRLTFNKGTIFIKSECVGIQPIAFGKNKSNIKKFERAFKEAASVTSDNEFVGKYFEIKRLYTRNKNKASVLTAKEKVSDIFSIFFSGKDFYFTSKILAVNVFIYLLMLMTGSYEPAEIMHSLYNFGALHRGLIIDGQWWRLLTSAFVHLGFLHLFFNMYAFLYAGLILEPLLGRFKFLFVYLSLAFLSGLTSVYVFANTTSAGASGAIFGMYGLILSLVITGVIRKKMRISLFLSLVIFTAYNLYNSFEAGIDYAAHVGGFLWGFVLGFLILPFLKKEAKISYKIATTLVFAVSITAYSAFVMKKITRHPSVFLYDDPQLISIISKASARQIQADENTGTGEIHYSATKEYYRNRMRYYSLFYKILRLKSELYIKSEELLLKKYTTAEYLLEKHTTLLKEMNKTASTGPQRNFIINAAIWQNENKKLFDVYIHALKHKEINYGRYISICKGSADHYDRIMIDLE